MKKVMLHRSIVVLPAVVLAMTLLGACGDPSKKSTSPAVSVPVQGAALVGMRACSTCHTAETADWLTNKHSNLNAPGGLDGAGVPALADISGCTANCHDPNGESNNLIAGYTGNVPRPVVGCEACHGGGSLHATGGGTGPIGIAALPGGLVGSTQVSAQFKTCTSCHELLNSDGTGVATAAHTTTAPTGTANVITDTHFATAPAVYGNVNNPATGYVMDFASETVCSDCHNPHKPADIPRQWSQSLHANMAGTSAWVRLNWSTRPACQRCHAATAAAAFADAMRSGDKTTADQILYGTLSSSPVASTAAWKPELLLCRGCHLDRNGTLRNPGPYTANYNYNFYSSPVTTYSIASHAYPDVAGSNICIPCHSGRQNGDSVKNMNQPGTQSADFSNFSSLTDHHFTAAATVFATGGYAFTGRSYEDPSFYMHNKIGTPAAPNTGTNGPCVGCHMSRPDKHQFLPVDTTTGDIFGTITSVATTVCNVCHPGGDALDMAPGMLERQKALLADATSAFTHQLEQAGLYWRNGNGYYLVRNSSLISAGTASVVNGSAVVKGKTTNWALTGLQAGDQFRVDSDGVWYDIASVDAASQITLSAVYAGATNIAGTNYLIRKTETVSVVTGTTTVIGSRTNWVSVAGLVAAGDTFSVDSNGTVYTIASVDSDTGLTLTAPYAGPSTTATAFTLRNTATALVTKGSKTVPVTGANLVTLDVVQGDFFRVGSSPTGTWYSIASRTTNTLVLSAAYAETTDPAASYTITRSVASKNWLTRGDTDLSGNTTGKNSMGAGLNRYMMDPAQEPGAFAHNRFYVKRLIYDSIDWLDDGILNFSTGATLNANCAPGPARPAWCDGAMSYLLPFGVFTNSSIERP